MVLILTYHRIVRHEKDVRSFFDVTAENLDLQLKYVKAAWGGLADTIMPVEKGAEFNGINVLVTFDDGTQDHFEVAAKVLEKNGIKGVFFVSTSRLGLNGFLSAEHCRLLNQAGHYIESHSHQHADLSQMSDNDVTHQLSTSYAVLQDIGVGQLKYLAPPGGLYDPRVLVAARQAGYKMLRTLKWGYNRDFPAFLTESFTVNARTSSWIFSQISSPRHEQLKKIVYRAKEQLKSGPINQMYYWARGR